MSINKKIETACIIDDDQIYVYGFKKMISFRNLCTNLLDFANGKEAFDYLTNPANRDNLPDVIFLDINMPIMDGWDFIRHFGEIKHQLGKNITVYMVSSSINDADVNRAKSNLHISDYMVKPLNERKLLEAFNNAAA